MHVEVLQHAANSLVHYSVLWMGRKIIFRVKKKVSASRLASYFGCQLCPDMSCAQHLYYKHLRVAGGDISLNWLKKRGDFF